MRQDAYSVGGLMTTFITSDTHFSHKGICKFLRADGVTKERPWDNTEEMDEALVDNWNSVVRDTDIVIHLGDVVINRSALPILNRLNGVKKLVMGNHDVFRTEEYAEYFKSQHGTLSAEGFLLSHMPIHACNLHRWKGNFHGHLHSSRVMHNESIDRRYLCLSVEHTDYAPISLEDAIKLFEEQSNADIG